MIASPSQPGSGGRAGCPPRDGSSSQQRNNQRQRSPSHHQPPQLGMSRTGESRMSSLSLPPSRTIMYLPGLPPPIAPVSGFSHPSFSRQGPRAHASSLRGGFEGPGKPGHQHHLALRGPPCSMLGYPLSGHAVRSRRNCGPPVSSRQNRLFGKPLRRPTVCSRGAPRSSPQPNKTSQKHSPHVAVTHVLDNVVSAHSAPVPIPLQRTAGGGRRRWLALTASSS